MISAQWIKDLFSTILHLFSIVSDFLFVPLADLIQDWIGVNLPNWGWLNYSLFFIMLDAGLIFFVCYTLVKWVIGLIT